MPRGGFGGRGFGGRGFGMRRFGAPLVYHGDGYGDGFPVIDHIIGGRSRLRVRQ